MRHPFWFVLNPEQSIIEFNKEEFDVYAANREESYEYIQTFDDNNIVEYTTVVVNALSNEAKARYHDVVALYKISPQEIRILWNQEDYIFRFSTPMSKAWAARVGKILENLYQANARFYTFYRYDHRNVLDPTWTTNVGLLNSIWAWIDDGLKNPINDVKNSSQLEQARSVDPALVVASMKRVESVDSVLGIIIWHGSGLSYVLGCLRSVEATYKFYSENFWIEFADTYESMEEYINEGIFVSGNGIVRSGGRLVIINDKGEAKELADFDITVHYKIRRKDKVSYVVSLIRTDSEVRHIEWPMSLNKTKVAEFISSFGPYHITASDVNLKRLHEMISTSQVPDITVYYKYGKAKYGKDDLIIFKDYVYNYSKRVAIPKLNDSSFYFIDGINGIKVEWRDGVDIDTMLIDKAPSMGMAISHKFKEFHSVTKQAFTDSSWELILMTASAWLWHSLFWGDLPCPMFFTTGITGSGKTTYAKYLCSLFWIEKPISIEWSTPFPLRISLTLLNELPLFLNEFRTKMQWAPEKTSILKSLFDGTAFERGKKDLSIESHKFSAYAFMEGEELPESGATRSRSLIWKVKRWGQWKGIPEDILSENRQLMNSFCYSYYQQANKERYRQALEEGYELFNRPHLERRILTNIALLYAGSMCIAPEFELVFRKVCNEVLDTQIEDFGRNGTVAEIINILGRYMGSRYSKVYVDGYHLVLPWNDIIDFVERSRITTELKINNYRDHVEASGIETWQFIVDANPGDEFRTRKQIMVDGLRIYIASIDKRLLCNETAFELYTHYNNVIKK